MSLPNRSEVSAPGLLGRHLSYWRRALYGGFQAGALTSAGWVVFLIVQAAISDPMRMLVSLIGGPLLHLAWEYGGAWLLGLEHEHAGEQSKSSEDPSPIAGSSTVPFKKWKRMALGRKTSILVVQFVRSNRLPTYISKNRTSVLLM